MLCLVLITKATSATSESVQVKLRGESMQAAADAVKSGMVSVIGLDSAAVAALCAAATERVGADKPVQIANYLCPGNYAVSGSEEVRSPKCVYRTERSLFGTIFLKSRKESVWDTSILQVSLFVTRKLPLPR